MEERRTSAGHLTNRAARLFKREIETRLREIGLLPSQLPVLLALADLGTLSQKALVEIAAVEQPSMAVTLSRMERGGLILRRVDPDDGRASLIELTPAAIAKLDGVRLAIRLGNDRALSGFSADERALYLAFLNRIISNLS